MKICCLCEQPVTTGFWGGKSKWYCKPCYAIHEAELERKELAQRTGEEVV